MVRDYCAHTAAFYERLALTLRDGPRAPYDAAWAKCWAYNKAAKFGRKSPF